MVASGAVNPNDYRTCAQSPFCQRTRNAGGAWAVVADTLRVKKNAFSCEVTDGQNLFILSVTFLSAGIPRIRIAPQKSEKFVRYDVSLEGDIIDQKELHRLDPISMSKNDTHVELKSGSGSIIIYVSNMRIDYLSPEGKHIATLNGDGRAVFETNKPCEPAVFRRHRDMFKNGANAVAMSVAFFGENVHFFGLPAHTLPFDLPETRRDPIRLWNTDINSFDVDSPMAMYGSVPFVFAHAQNMNAGVLWLNPSETWVDLKYPGDNEKTARFMSETGYIDVFLFSNQRPSEITEKLTTLSGRPMMIPLFALGLHQSRWGYLTQDEVLRVSSRLDEIQTPHETIWLDLDYTIGRQYMTWNSGFPDPLAMLNKMQESKRGIVVIVDPHLKASVSSTLYREARKRGILLKDKFENEYIAQCWPGLSAWPDFLNPAAKKWWASQFSYKKFKTSAPNLWIWNDMNEIAVFESVGQTAPKDVIHYKGHEEREVHNVYGALMVSGTYQGLVDRDRNKDRRPFILTRSFFLGSHKYALVWSGDNDSEWSHLRNSIQLVLSFGIGGQVYSGSDVGGFFGSPSPELLSRWYQVGAWCYPFFRVHCHHLSKYREMYELHGVNREVALEAVYDRYRLMPYWYTLARHANLTGEPLIRPIWWHFDEPEFVSVDNKVLLGSALLVCPFLDNNPMSIHLPASSRWFLYKTLEEVSGENEFSLNDGRTVVFMRGGSIVPMRKRIRKSVGFMEYDPVSLRVCLDSDGKASGELYLDDGYSFSFMKGDFVHRQFSFENGVFKNSGKGVSSVTIEDIEIAGLNREVHSVRCNFENLEFEVRDRVLYIQRLKLDVSANFEIEIV